MINKILIFTVLLFFIRTISYSQEMNIKKDGQNMLIFNFENNTNELKEIPKLLWRTFNKKQNKLTGIINEHYVKFKGDTLIINLNKETPEYFKGSVNEKVNEDNPMFLDIKLQPKEQNEQLIMINGGELINIKYIKFCYAKISYFSSL